MRDRRWIMATAALVLVAAAAVVGAVLALGDGDEDEERPAAPARNVTPPAYTTRGGYLGGTGSLRATTRRGATPSVNAGQSVGLEPDEEPELGDMLLASYQLRAYPRRTVGFAETAVARRAFAQIGRPLSPNAGGVPGRWKLLGPTTATAIAYGNARRSPTSGRVVSIAVAPRCVPGNCRLYLGTAGGGVWRTDNALAPIPAWASVSNGITSGGIGFLAVDPHDRTGRTVYAGTGELRSGADSTVGVGVFKTTDAGNSWSLVPGSEAVAKYRAVTGIIVDPRNPRVLYVSTGPTLRGASSVSGGATGPPTGESFGVFRSKNGGATFAKLYSSAFPGTTVSRPILQIALDPNDPDTLYVSALGLGVLRRSPRLDGDGAFHRIFVPRPGISEDLRQFFAAADLGRKTRIYVGDSDPFAESGTDDFQDSGVAHLYRVDHARVKASALVRRGKNTKAWKLLSSANPTSPGFDSYRYCTWGCWYSNYVASPPGRPNHVYLPNAFDYKEADEGVSNGRAVIRSTDAGATFSDLTADARARPVVMHPDQHAIAFSPNNPDIAFLGSDGGLVRTSGRYVSNAVSCNGRGLAAPRLKRCKRLLRAVPTRIFSMNTGLSTLQFQSVSLSPNEQVPEVLGGTQDNGTWAYSKRKGWTNVQGGDGGQSVVDVELPNVRLHTFFGPVVEINYNGNNPQTWYPIFAPLVQSGEAASFYLPLIGDPVVGGTTFAGLQHVWRATNYAGGRKLIEARCAANIETVCGNWRRLGRDLTGTAYGNDRGGEFVAAVERAPGDETTLWAATLPGRVFVAKNADGPAPLVKFNRIDIPTRGGRKGTPSRFVSGIAIDPKDGNHAWISYSGYDSHTPGDLPGHVFEVRFDPATAKATWTNRTYDLGDQPITDVAVDPNSGDLYASSDFGVMRLPEGGKSWAQAAPGLPYVPVFGLTMTKSGATLYAATHGRGIWTLAL